MKDKDFFTVGELVRAPWFALKSDATIKKLIEFGKLKAVDVSTNPKYREFRIDKMSALQYAVNRDERYKKNN